LIQSIGTPEGSLAAMPGSLFVVSLG